MELQKGPLTWNSKATPKNKKKKINIFRDIRSVNNLIIMAVFFKGNDIPQGKFCFFKSRSQRLISKIVILEVTKWLTSILASITENLILLIG